MHVKPMKLDMKVYEWVPPNFNNSINVPELFGVEVELEGQGGITKPGPDVGEMWTVHNDGSLRKMGPLDEAIEYVTRMPYSRDDITKAVVTLCNFLNQPKFKVYDSYRTSIHVHVNCMADTQLHVCNFITLCLLFDELFVSQNGDHRIGNNFCLRAKDAQGQIQELIRSIEMNNSIFGVNQNMRYSSVNFASLTKFGTVEFRSLECTTDPFRILHWIKTIDSMKQASRLFENPQEIIRKFSQVSLQEFVLQVLGPQAAKYMKVAGYEEMLFSGMRLAQEFAFCSKWIQRTEADAKKAKAKDDEIMKKLKKMQQAPGGMGLQPMLAPAGQLYQQYIQQDIAIEAQFQAQPMAGQLIEYEPAPPPPPHWDDQFEDDDDDFYEGPVHDLDDDF